MGFWPFWRKRKVPNNIKIEKSAALRNSMAQTVETSTEKEAVGGEKPLRTDSKRRRTEKSSAMSKASSSGLRESTPTPSSARVTGGSARHTLADSIGDVEKADINQSHGERKVYQHNPMSASSVGQDNFTVLAKPTLHAKRRENDSSMPRHKSSKRKAEDQARERSLRAMSSPIPAPKRPMSYSEGPLRRETKKAPTRLQKRGDRPTSEVSLPLPESFTELDAAPIQNSYKVNALDVLSPRPTIRYNKNQRYTPTKSQNQSRQSVRQMIPEEDFSSKKRIDNLADSLDAGALRELMERDQRRRERKRQTDQAKLEQKLKRRAEYEKEQEAERTRQKEALEKGIAGPALSNPAAELPAALPRHEEARADPFADENAIELDLPILPIPRPGSSTYSRTSQASFSPPTSPTQRAFDRASPPPSGLVREATPDIADIAELNRKASEQSGAQLGTWTSFFRRGGNRGKRSSMDRGRHASAEFSNTSRDSITKNQPQASIVGAPRTFRRSGTPQRTQSKFREDLPELPLSPPDSRVQSPEIGTSPTLVSVQPDRRESAPPSSRVLATSSSKGTFDQRSADDNAGPAQTIEPQTPPPAAALSRSLASVDSEASWLSGRPAKRSSATRDHPLRQSQSSLQPYIQEPDFREEADVADDPYFSNLSPGPAERRRSSPMSALRKASSTALNIEGDSDQEGEPELPPLPETGGEKWHMSLERQPTLVRQAAQARSKEGLLKDYQAADPENEVLDDEASDPDLPDAEDSDLQATSSPIFRAQSINYGMGHVRHISAGSAKLLDIRRSSIDPTDSKRQSMQRRDRSSTPIRNPGMDDVD
jgi:hypothetical protein